MAIDDFPMTIDSDVEEEPVSNPNKATRGKSQPVDTEEALLNPEFSFDLTGDTYTDILDSENCLRGPVKTGSKPEPISVDDIIVRRRRISSLKKRKRDSGEGIDDPEVEGSESRHSGDKIGSEDDEDNDAFGGSGFGEEEEADPLISEDELENEGGEDGLSDSSDETEPETQAEKDRKAAFFDSDVAPLEAHNSFLTTNLSRPILKAITTLGFLNPTPIQAATIPIALLGKDIVGGAVTGSGKTAAFIIPMLERLLYRDKGKRAAATRCLILVPTRELAVQCHEVGTKLAAHTDIRFCLIVGGLSVKAQEVELRSRPDVVIATPGRLIDHIRNSPCFSLDSLDILVLDEADRMLSDGFADELAEIIKACPTSRQTMLFSATMTDSVDELVKMSLSKPVRLFVDPKRSTARGLVQEFVRVRAVKEAERSALLVALCKETFKSGVLIFLRSKKLAHQLRIAFSLLGMKCEELHGDLSQEQRLRALQLFRDGAADYLLATDLASRGLDIKGIETVINYDMPGQLAQYLHRVGRTARAGKKGRSVTLVGEADRKMLKAAIKHSSGEDQVRHRVITPVVVSKWSAKLAEMKEEVAEILQEEKEEKEIRQAERELKKGQNMLEHQEEIYSRPARTWFQSEKDKLKAEAVSKQQYEKGFDVVTSGKQAKAADESKPKRDKFSGLTRKAKRRKMAMEEINEVDNDGAVKAAIRSAKKSARPTKIGIPQAPPPKRAKSLEKKSRRAKATIRTGSGFDRDLGQNPGRSEGVRARKGDAVSGIKKVVKRKGK